MSDHEPAPGEAHESQEGDPQDWESVVDEGPIIIEGDEELMQLEEDMLNDEEECKEDAGPQEPPNFIHKHVGHAAEVYSIAVHPTIRSCFVSGGGDDVAMIWEIGKEAPVVTLKGHTDTVQRVAYNFDGSLIATGCMDSTVKIWDSKNGELKLTLDGPTEIESIQWHKKGNAILAGSADKSVWMWNANNGEFMAVCSGHEAAVTHCTFSLDGKKIISGSEDGSVRTWNPKSGECIDKIKGYGFHENALTSLKLHHERPIILTGSVDRTACISNYELGKAVGRTPEHMDSIEDVEFIPTQDIFGTASLDGKVRVFDLSKLLLRETVNIESGLTKLTYHEGKKVFVVSGNDGLVGFFDYREKDPAVSYFYGHTKSVNDFVIVDEHTILSASDDHTILLFDMRKAAL